MEEERDEVEGERDVKQENEKDGEERVGCGVRCRGGERCERGRGGR